MSEISAEKARAYGNDDPVSNCRQITDSNHSQVHAGNAYQTVIPIDATVAGTSFYVIMTVPAATFAHFQNILLNVVKAGADEVSIAVYEDVVYAAPLVPNITPRQRNRVFQGFNPAAVSALALQSGVAIPTDLGTLVMDPTRVASATAARGGSGLSSSGDGIERITNFSTDYCFVISVIGSSGTPLIDFILDWYEEVAGVAP